VPLVAGIGGMEDERFTLNDTGKAIFDGAEIPFAIRRSRGGGIPLVSIFLFVQRLVPHRWKFRAAQGPASTATPA